MNDEFKELKAFTSKLPKIRVVMFLELQSVQVTTKSNNFSCA